MVTKEDIKSTIKELNLDGRSISLHSSYKSFGGQIDSPKTIIDSFIELGCTLLTPTFSYNYLLNPNKENRPLQNDWDYSIIDPILEKNKENIFSTNSNDVDSDMGIIPKLILNTPGRVRGFHPLDSLTALGPDAEELVSSQEPLDIFAPFRKLVEANGYIILMGVNYNRMTFLHYCEKVSGRNTFIRWAADKNGETMPVEIGECSEGFINFSKVLDNIAKIVEVGSSTWKILPAKEVLNIASNMIKEDPKITACSNKKCRACIDAINGGPII